MHFDTIEDRIRNEFAIAFEMLEQAPTEQKQKAESRLNRAVRRLIDFVAYGKHESFRQRVASNKTKSQ